MVNQGRVQSLDQTDHNGHERRQWLLGGSQHSRLWSPSLLLKVTLTPSLKLIAEGLSTGITFILGVT